MAHIEWVCAECGHIVLSEDRPFIHWDDGHVCIFVQKDENENHNPERDVEAEITKLQEILFDEDEEGGY
jgi:hypothetical protein